MNSRKEKVMVKVLSRTGARFIYGAFGLTFVVFGILGGCPRIEAVARESGFESIFSIQ